MALNPHSESLYVSIWFDCQITCVKHFILRPHVLDIYHFKFDYFVGVLF